METLVIVLAAIPIVVFVVRGLLWHRELLEVKRTNRQRVPDLRGALTPLWGLSHILTEIMTVRDELTPEKYEQYKKLVNSLIEDSENNKKRILFYLKDIEYGKLNEYSSEDKNQ